MKSFFILSALLLLIAANLSTPQSPEAIQALKTLHILHLLPTSPAPMNALEPLQTVAFVDLERYAGKWFEIASFPQRFQKGCKYTTAEYTATEEGFIIVENNCTRDSIGGKSSYITGKAFVEKNSGNAKLKVQFFWPFRGKYWIIDLADDYSYAVVSHPNRKYLWILSRTPTLNDMVYRQITTRLEQKGFDLSKLSKTIQID